MLDKILLGTAVGSAVCILVVAACGAFNVVTETINDYRDEKEEREARKKKKKETDGYGGD